MSGELNELKKKYNKLLDREKKAEEWLDSPEQTDSQVERWMPEFRGILDGLNKLLTQIGSHTTDETINGFKI